MSAAVCAYCGGRHQRVNQRGGLECSNCSAPITSTAAENDAPVDRRAECVRRGNFTRNTAGDIVEIDDVLRDEWEAKYHAVIEIKLNAQDFTDALALVTDHASDRSAPIFRAVPTLFPPGRRPTHVWYFNRYSPSPFQLVKVVLDPAASGIVVSG